MAPSCASVTTSPSVLELLGADAGSVDIGSLLDASLAAQLAQAARCQSPPLPSPPSRLSDISEGGGAAAAPMDSRSDQGTDVSRLAKQDSLASSPSMREALPAMAGIQSQRHLHWRQWGSLLFCLHAVLELGPPASHPSRAKISVTKFFRRLSVQMSAVQTSTQVTEQLGLGVFHTASGVANAGVDHRRENCCHRSAPCSRDQIG